MAALPQTAPGGWPIQVQFWLEWGSSTAGQSLLEACSRFRLVYSDSIFTHPMQTLTPGPSTPQIIALAMICSGRDDRVERSEHPHSSQSGLEWEPVRRAAQTPHNRLNLIHSWTKSPCCSFAFSCRPFRLDLHHPSDANIKHQVPPLHRSSLSR
jgi:hypothetical protein